MSFTLRDADVLRFRDQVLGLAAHEDLDSTVVVAALADVLAITAATLDLRAGRQTLNDRLGPFLARVEQTYQRVRTSMESPNLFAHPAVLGGRPRS